MNSLGN